MAGCAIGGQKHKFYSLLRPAQSVGTRSRAARCIRRCIRRTH